MTRLITLLLASLVLLSSFGGIAAAQTTVNASDTASPTDSETTYLIEIDNTTRIVSAEWSDGTVTMTIESDLPKQIAITDSSQDINGAIDIKQSRLSIPRGTTTVEFTVANPSDPAVTVGSPNGMVGLGEQSGGSLFTGPASWTDVRSAGAAGVVAGVGMVLGIAWVRVSSKDDEHRRTL